MSILIPPIGWKAGGKSKASIEFLKAQQYGSSSSFTLSGIVVPKAGLLIVGGAWRTFGSSTSFGDITIGGSVGTKNVTTPASLQGACVASKEVAAGTLSVVAPATVGNFAFGGALCAWLLTDYGGPAPHQTDSQTGFGSSSSVSLNVPSDGIAVFAHIHTNGNAASWSGAEVAAQFDVSSNRIAFADLTVPAGASPHTETVTWTGSISWCTVAASWA